MYSPLRGILSLLSALLLTGPSLQAQALSSQIIRNTARELDEVLMASQNAQAIRPNAIIDDATFLRRSHLNIIGRLPTHDEAASFLASEDEDKRASLIDTLVASPGFDSRLFDFWGDLLRLQTRSEHHGLGWHVWLKESVTQNKPYNEMVRQMLSAQGHIAEDPAVGYYLRDRGMLLDNVSNTVEVFLGQQIGCAQCHDHPFDDTTQMEYYQLASFLGGTEYRFNGSRAKVREAIDMGPRKSEAGPQEAEDPEPVQLTKRQKRKLKKKRKSKKSDARDISSIFRYHNRNALYERPGKQLKLPTDYQYEDGKPGDIVKPGLLFGFETQDISPENRRSHFANWVTAPENPYFTKVIANRMWKYAFGYGLVANPDDWSSSPDPHYPELVAYLEKAMRATDYDLKQFLRILYHTQLFQREVTTQEPAQGFSFHFQGPALRRLSATEIRDTFITLAAGNIDSNSNSSFQESWDKYTSSFQALMAADASELREINAAMDSAEAKRRKVQKQVSLLRTTLRTAKEEGDTAAAQQVTAQLRALKRSSKKKYQEKMASAESDVLGKVRSAVARRAPKSRANHKPLQLRASELSSPQRGGSFISEFGGSDAESPSSAHTQATVPQHLRLLNGAETSLLTDRNNAFARGLRQLTSPAERLDYLFLSLYSALPTEAEKERFLPEVQSMESTGTLARAILTSNRFLFVQ